MSCEKERDIKFVELYQKYQNDVYRTCLKYTHNEHDAQDIAQKVFTELYLRMDKIQPERVVGYLVRAAKNMSLNWLRDTKREREGVCIDDIIEREGAYESVEDTYIYADERHEKETVLSTIMTELYMENKMWHDILECLYFLEMSHDETAKMLGITKAVLYSKLYRAKQWVDKRYREKSKEF